jgi:hypothetical protein
MLTKTKVALSVAIVLGTASGAFARNQGSIYTDPDSTPNGPFFYVNTYGVRPTVLRPIQEPRRLPRRHY